MKLEIKRLGYSSNPWRLLYDNGEEVYTVQTFDHPMMGGPISCHGPVCADTKSALVDKVLEMLVTQSSTIERLQGRIGDE
jgi:hypothetical protein